MRTLKWLGRNLSVAVPPLAVAMAAQLTAHQAGASQTTAVGTGLVVYGAAAYAWLTLYSAWRVRRANPLPTPPREA
ncbi:hypothetical protein [Streptomyces sp. NBC_00035]|uniref:hypothetical protein n=1 Tax=Streptomyces sp. NBC_00035 TaxID=2903614 RepID=UPI0032481487